MSAKEALEKVARDIAAQMTHRIDHFQRELMAIETHRIEVEGKLRAATVAQERLTHYSVQERDGYRCPNCWIGHERHSTLAHVTGASAAESYYLCPTCGTRYSLPASG